MLIFNQHQLSELKKKKSFQRTNVSLFKEGATSVNCCVQAVKGHTDAKSFLKDKNIFGISFLLIKIIII